MFVEDGVDDDRDEGCQEGSCPDFGDQNKE